jgi:hypothetical protein
MTGPMSDMIEAVFFLPVAAKDVNRAAYAVRSIRKYCEQYRIYLLLDGCDPSALAPELSGQDIRILCANLPSGGNWGKIWLLQIRGMVEANREPDVSADAIFVRIDADALIIRKGLTERAKRIFLTRPAAGQIGQTFSNVRGARFANAGWSNYITKIMGWRGLLQFIRAAHREGEGLKAGLQAFLDFRAIVKGAVANSYVYGEICLGCCNAMRRELIAAMSARISIDKSPFRFLPILGDDIVMTLHTYWLGYAPMDDSSDDGLCGIEVKGFRVNPFVLKNRGHYVLHPLKYGYHAEGHDLNEDELVSALLKS